MTLCNMYACLGQEGQDSGRTTFSNVLEAYDQARLAYRLCSCTNIRNRLDSLPDILIRSHDTARPVKFVI